MQRPLPVPPPLPQAYGGRCLLAAHCFYRVKELDLWIQPIDRHREIPPRHAALTLFRRTRASVLPVACVLIRHHEDQSGTELVSNAATIIRPLADISRLAEYPDIDLVLVTLGKAAHVLDPQQIGRLFIEQYLLHAVDSRA